MYKGFNLTALPYPKEMNEELHQIGSEQFTSQKKIVRSALRELVLQDGSLDGQKLQSQWFPQVEADVFISHSHDDTDSALVLAGILRKHFNIKSFIDTTIWGYGSDLLRNLDNIYCTNGKAGSFDYGLRNLSTSHVYLMLAGALSKLIDNTECVFFLNTPSSVKPSQIMDSTLSPWLYFEVLTTQTIRKTLPNDHLRRQQVLEKSFSDTGPIQINESFKMTHKIELGHLTTIEADDDFFRRWLKQSAGVKFKLDTLYQIFEE